jgi:MYXO-CTERM domain-containing protein
MHGEHLFETVTIAGPLDVLDYNPADPTTGWLHIRAEEITVAAAGVIDAAGKGYRAEADGGQGYESGAGQSPALTVAPQPGGGGAHAGAGGPGVNISDCSLFLEAAGGTAYDATGGPLGLFEDARRLGGLGSAGGSGWGTSGTNPYHSPGGVGGGMVVLEAATVTFEGAIHVDGGSPPPSSTGYGVFYSAPGGGAGGSVVILANTFSFGTGAQITARGGGGYIDSDQLNVVGGSGGGGRVTLQVGAEHQSFASQIQVGGGAAPSACTESAGQDGLIEIVDSPPCIDADRDGHRNVDCGGEDCDDGQASINPDQEESCNLIDDNCRGGIDEQEEDAGPICDQGSSYICDDTGACVPDPNAPLPPVPQRPQYVRIGGGLCASRPSPAPPGHRAGLLLIALVLGGAFRRRRARATTDAGAVR